MVEYPALTPLLRMAMDWVGFPNRQNSFNYKVIKKNILCVEWVSNSDLNITMHCLLPSVLLYFD